MSNYPPDRTWGPIIAFLCACCSCFVLFASFFASILFGLIGHKGGPGNSPVLFGVLAGLTVVVGILVSGFYALGVLGGIGIARGKKWGFNLTLTLALIRVILNVANLPAGLFGIAIDVASLIYCYQRLSGNLGPRPIY